VADATVVGAARLGASAVGALMPPVTIAAHGIVEPAGDPLIVERQHQWRAAVERAGHAGSRGEGA
jgi:hypothetical protein